MILKETMNRPLTKLKYPRTNWKYILIVVILAFIVGGGILEWQWRMKKEEILITQFQEIKRPEEIKALNPKKEVAENELPLLFKRIFPEELVIFPNGITKCDINKIADLNEKANVYFKGPHYDWDNDCWGNIVYVELDGKPDIELFVFPHFVQSYLDLEIPGKWACYKNDAFQGYIIFDEDGNIRLPKQWFPNEQNYLTYKVEIGAYDEEKERHYDKLIIKFEKAPNLFPSSEGLIKENFDPIHEWNKEKLTIIVRIYDSAKSIKLFGRNVLVQRSRVWMGQPEIDSLYVFRWDKDRKKWDLIGILSYCVACTYKVGEITEGYFADILVTNPGTHTEPIISEEKYKFIDTQYRLVEVIYPRYNK
jgi:hypothetical protein